jgi:hypothetical protein
MPSDLQLGDLYGLAGFAGRIVVLHAGGKPAATCISTTSPEGGHTREAVAWLFSPGSSSSITISLYMHRS